MRNLKIFFVLLTTMWLSTGSAAIWACESGHWISSVTSDGRIVILGDGSVWEVDSLDRIYSTLWLPSSSIVACSDKLINTDDGETVQAERIR